MVFGTILVYYAPTSILFDSGILHCFMSSIFVIGHNISFENLTIKWNISTGHGGIISNKICKLCLVVVCKRKFHANFLIINIYGFDEIDNENVLA